MYIQVEIILISLNYQEKLKLTVQATTIIIIKNPLHKITACIIAILEVLEVLTDIQVIAKFNQTLI